MSGSDSKVDYYSPKQKYTVNTQPVVGADLVFVDIDTGFPAVSTMPKF